MTDWLNRDFLFIFNFKIIIVGSKTTLAYREFYPSVKETPRANVINLFTAVIYECSYYVSLCFLGKLFQASLMLASKAGAFSNKAHYLTHKH
jgi:hypothetical protein